MRSLRLPLQISERKTLLVVVDLLLVNSAVLVALGVWALRDPLRSFSREFVLSQAHWFLILTAIWSLAAFLNDFYNLGIADNRRSSGVALLRVILLELLAYLIIYFFFPPQSLPRGIVLYHGAVSFALVAVWRGVYVFLLSRAPFQSRAIVAGAGWAGRTIVRAIRENVNSPYWLLGYIDDDPAKQGQIIEGLPIVGTHHDLVSLVKENDISEVILAITHEMHGELIQAIMDCQEQGIRITPMHHLYEEITSRIAVEHIGEQWSLILPMEHAGTGTFLPPLKRAMDLFIAGIGLLILAPLFPFLALAIYLDSPGPIFYSQERVGQGGRVFRVFKFRSMIPNAEEDNGAVWAEENDPRVTRVGWFLRRAMIDELPQFINVLRGEMSIVGPRPERPIFADQLAEKIPFYRARHGVKPGMAGWALINYGYSSSVRDALIRLQYDLYYIKHQSIWLDILVLLRTLAAMVTLKGRG